MPGTRYTTDGEPPHPDHRDESAPKPVNPETGQHGSYWVLPPEERAKGFVRPYRDTYKHVGPKPPGGELRDLSLEEAVRYATMNYIKFEDYPDSESSLVGRFWTHAQLDALGGCGTTTKMGRALSETYAREPSYYGSTFCHTCDDHLPVGEGGEFVWEGTDERVGT